MTAIHNNNNRVAKIKEFITLLQNKVDIVVISRTISYPSMVN